jgi:hypothetical protein
VSTAFFQLLYEVVTVILARLKALHEDFITRAVSAALHDRVRLVNKLATVLLLRAPSLERI